MRVGITASTYLVSLALASVAGCGGDSASSGVTTAPVKGKVTYKGQPLTVGTISFEPENSGREATGEIKSDGSFVLTTYKKEDGAVLGMNRVQVSAGSKAARVVVPAKFQNYGSSKIQVEVSVDKIDYAIDLK